MLITGFPVVGMIDANAEKLLSIYRIAFGLLLVLRIYRSKKAYVLIRSNKSKTKLLFKLKLLCAFSLIFVWAMRLMACFFLINRVIPWSAASSRDPVCSVSSTSWSRRRSPSRGSRSGHPCVVWSSWLKAWRRTARSRLSPPSLTGGEFLFIYVWAIVLTMFFCQQGHHR